MEDLTFLKKKYNFLLQREKKALLYLDNKNIKLEIIEKIYVPEYQKIILELSKISKQIPGAKDSELLNGFNI